MKELIEDAIRFIQYNREIIETVPLQTYFSAIIFAPECSLIRKAFISNICEGVPLVLNRPNTWGPWVQTLFGHKDRIVSLAFSPTSQLLVSSSMDGTVRVWETKTGNCQRILSHGYDLGDANFSPDSKQIVSIGMEKICLWDTDTGERIHKLYRAGRCFPLAAFAYMSKLLVSEQFDMSVSIWCTETGNLLRRLYIGKDIHFGYLPHLVAFSPDLKTLALGDSAVVTIWDIEAAKEVCSFPHGRSRSLKRIAFSPNSKLLASVEWCFDYRYWHSINVWCITTGRKLKSYQDAVCNDLLEEKLVFASNTELVITTTQGLYRWQFQSSSDMVFVSDIEPISIADISSDMTLLAGSDDSGNTIRVWQLHPSDNRVVIPKKDHLSNSEHLWVKVSPDSSIVASWSVASTTITLQRTDTGECSAIFKMHQNTITAMTISPDSSTLISCDEKGILRLWNLATGECMNVLSMLELESTNKDSRVTQIAVSADMGIIACGQSKRIFILQRNNEKEYRCIAKHSGPYHFWPGQMNCSADDLEQIEISSKSLFVTWENRHTPSVIRRVHWCINLDEPLQLGAGRKQADTNVYMIPNDQQSQGETDSSDFSWVTKNKEPLVWIPDEFRPQSGCQRDSLGSMIAIGTSLDLTIIMDFSRQPNGIINKDDETKILKRKRGDSESDV